MTLRSAHPLTLIATGLLGVGILALLAVLLPSMVWSEAETADAAIDPKLLHVDAPNLLPLAAYQPVIAHPLFNEARRSDPPPPPPAPPKPPPLPPISSYRLAGLILTSDIQLAFVERLQGNTTIRLRAGDNMDGWSVQSIDQAGIVLTGQGSTLTLKVVRSPAAASARRADIGAQSPVAAQSNPSR